MVQISEQRFFHVKTFVNDMLDMLPLSHVDNDLTLEHAMRGLGWYTARTDHGVYILLGMPGQRVRLNLEYTLTAGVPYDQLARIATSQEVQVYRVMEDGFVPNGPAIMGLRNIEMFPFNGPPLTFEKFVEGYLFRVLKAAEAVHEYKSRLPRST